MPAGMEGAEISTEPHTIWAYLGIVGAVVFYARFYIQWIYSEIRKRSIVPIAFWYLSGLGSFLLLLYSVSLPSPVGALSHTFNAIIYSRNVHFVWRDRGQASAARTLALHAVAGLVVAFGLTMLVITWRREMMVSPGPAAGLDPLVLFWILVGAVGQGLFALRFVMQWLATERAGRSIVPNAFWYISVAAASLLLLAHLSRREWIFVAGLTSTLFVYARNIVFIRRGATTEAE